MAEDKEGEEDEKQRLGEEEHEEGGKVDRSVQTSCEGMDDGK